MSINPTGNYSTTFWNYSNPNKEGYSPILEGTVCAIQEVQKHVFGQPGVGEFWPDGNPKMNIRISLNREDGTISMFEFSPAGKAARMGQRKSIHMDLFNLSGGDMFNLIGETIIISTVEGVYGAGNPRPFSVQKSEKQIPMPEKLPEDLQVAKVLCNNSAAGGQLQPPQQPVAAYQQPYQAAAPAPYQQPQMPPQAYQPQPPAQPQAMPQPVPQPQVPQQGWQQNVMQQFPGAQITQMPDVYGDVPF